MKTFNQFISEAYVYANKDDLQEIAPLALLAGAGKLASLGLGAYSAYSAVKNLQKGNYKGAALDALGVIPGGKAFKAVRALGGGKNLGRAASAAQSLFRYSPATAWGRGTEKAIGTVVNTVTGGGNKKQESKPQESKPQESKPQESKPTSSTVLARKGGVMGKLDKATGKWTKGDWTDKESARYKRVADSMGKSTAPAAPTPVGVSPSPTKPATPAPTKPATPAPTKPATPAPTAKTPPTPKVTPTPKPKVTEEPKRKRFDIRDRDVRARTSFDPRYDKKG